MTYETGQQLYHRVELEGRDKLTVSGGSFMWTGASRP